MTLVTAPSTRLDCGAELIAELSGDCVDGTAPAGECAHL